MNRTVPNKIEAAKKNSTPDELEKCFTINPFLMSKIQEHLLANPILLFHLPEICAIISGVRLNQVSKDAIRTLQRSDPSVITNAIEHNLMGLQNLTGIRRPHLLIHALQSIGYFRKIATDAKVLTIGPRSEIEIMALMSAGIQEANISAIDLISYSPYISLGDMHQMRFEDNTFDVVIAGWVLGYSNNPQKAMDEMIRVAKPGALIAIGLEVSQISNEAWQAKAQSKNEPVINPSRFSKTADVLALAKEFIDEVPVRGEPYLPSPDSIDNLITIFSVK